MASEVPHTEKPVAKAAPTTAEAAAPQAPTHRGGIKVRTNPYQHVVRIPTLLAEQLKRDIQTTAKNNQHQPTEALESRGRTLARAMQADDEAELELVKQRKAQKDNHQPAEATFKGTQKPSHTISTQNGFTLLHPVGKPHSSYTVAINIEEVTLTADSINFVGNNKAWLNAIETANRLSTEEGAETQAEATQDRRDRAKKVNRKDIKTAQANQKATAQALKVKRNPVPKNKRRRQAVKLPSSLS